MGRPFWFLGGPVTPEGCGSYFTLFPRGGAFAPTRSGFNASGVGDMAYGNAGPFTMDVPGGVLVLGLEPMGTWNGVEGRTRWFEYEYHPSG